MAHFCALLVSICMFQVSFASVQYLPSWDSLDQRPLPSWYDEAKIGIFIHWGVFSVPSFGSEWFWYDWKNGPPNSTFAKFMNSNYKPDFSYADFGPMFTAELYDPHHWADVFEKAGAKYVVLTSKHHEGFCNWRTNVSFNWNSVAVGPHRDLVGDLAQAIKNKTDMRFGLYHSLLEWYNPLYLTDKNNKWSTQLFSLGKTIPELKEIVNAYQPELIWSDGEWEALDVYWNSTDFLAWLYNESPVRDSVVVNDRWGRGTMCKHGGYYTCTDRYNPGTLQSHKWENAMTIDKTSWGYRRNIDLSGYLTNKELISTLAETISCGGNLLVNIGPTHDGRILPIFEERLSQMGDWLQVNGEAVYSSKPWKFQNDTVMPGVWYTMKKSITSSTGYSVYAFFFEWPATSKLVLGSPVTADDTKISMLGVASPPTFKQLSLSVEISLPFVPPPLMPSQDGWVLKFDNLKNSA